MNLKKRIEALELAQAQNSCNHFLTTMKIHKSNGVIVKVEAVCGLCKKHLERTLIGKEICEAVLLLWEQIEPRK